MSLPEVEIEVAVGSSEEQAQQEQATPPDGYVRLVEPLHLEPHPTSGYWQFSGHLMNEGDEIVLKSFANCRRLDYYE